MGQSVCSLAPLTHYHSLISFKKTSKETNVEKPLLGFQGAKSYDGCEALKNKSYTFAPRSYFQTLEITLFEKYAGF